MTKRIITLKDGSKVTLTGKLFTLDILPGVEMMVHRVLMGVENGQPIYGTGFSVTELATGTYMTRALTSQRLAIDSATNRASHPGAAEHVLRKVAEALGKPAPQPVRPADPCDRPMSAKGLTSYRFKGTFGWVMIGATSHKDALSEAKRSTDAPITMSCLQVWSDKKQQYIAAR